MRKQSKRYVLPEKTFFGLFGKKFVSAKVKRNAYRTYVQRSGKPRLQSRKQAIVFVEIAEAVDRAKKSGKPVSFQEIADKINSKLKVKEMDFRQMNASGLKVSRAQVVGTATEMGLLKKGPLKKEFNRKRRKSQLTSTLKRRIGFLFSKGNSPSKIRNILLENGTVVAVSTIWQIAKKQEQRKSHKG